MFSVQCCNVQCTLRQTRHAASSRRHSLVTGRVRGESFVFTSAVRPCESSPGNTFVTRPSNQRDLGTVLSTTRTGSFTAKFLLFSSHLWCCCRVGTKSGQTTVTFHLSAFFQSHVLFTEMLALHQSRNCFACSLKFNKGKCTSDDTFRFFLL